MERLSRWTDNSNTLYVVLSRRGIIEKTGNNLTLKNTVVVLLKVHEETELEVPAELFEQKVRSGEIRQILKPLPKK
jgi:hypothetical protein